MTTRRSSATELGATLVAALAEKDFGQLADTLAPDVRMRALIPPGPVDISGAVPVAARFASWFGELDRLELVLSGADEVGDRLHVFYRLRTKTPGDPWKVVEQHLFCALDEDRLSAIDLACSGFRPELIQPPLTTGDRRADRRPPSRYRPAAQRQTTPPTIRATRPNRRSSNKECTP